MSYKYYCNDYFKCPECGSDLYTVHTKLPSIESMTAIEESQRGIIMYPIDSVTNKIAVVISCESGHKFTYDPKKNEYEIYTTR